MFSKTRLVGVALLSAAALSLAACSGSSGGTASSSAPAPSTSESSSGGGGGAELTDVKIGLVAVNLNSPSITRIKDAMVKSAESRGWTVEVFDGQGDQNATNNAALNFINRGFSAIVNDASPNEQMSAVIDAAHAKGIPFVSIYGGYIPSVDAEIGTNEFVNGSMVTAEMINALGGSGRVVKFNWTVLQALRDRDAAFKAVTGENKNIEVVKEVEVKVPGQVDDVYNQLTNILQSDKNIDAVWIGWDELAPPAVRAIEQAGLSDKTIVVGFDGNPFAWDLIRDNTPYIMEPANPFEPMGEKSVSVIEQLLKKEALASKIIYMKPCWINRQTVPAKDAFPDWENCAFFPGEIES